MQDIKPKLLSPKVSWLSIMKKKAGLLLICFSVIVASYMTMFQHYKTFRFEKNNGTVYLIESTLLDYRLKLRGPVKPSEKVGILAVDEKTIAQFGRWPFSRRYYAQAFANLKKMGVKWIGFDAIFSEPERSSGEDFAPLFQTLKVDGRSLTIKAQVDRYTEMMRVSPADLAFQKSVADFENIVLGYTYFASSKEYQLNGLNKNQPLPLLEEMAAASQIMADLPTGRKLEQYSQVSTAFAHLPNTPEITAAAKHFAFFSNNADSDAINRWITLVAQAEGKLMPSLALKTAAEYLDREIFVVFDEFGVETIALVNRQNPEDVLDIPIDFRGAGRMLLNPLGPLRSFHHYSLADAYNDSFSANERKRLKDSVLLLGGTAIGTNDIRPNAFDVAIDGVENHAAAMDNIISQNFLKRPVAIFKTELLIILGVGLLFAPLMIFSEALLSGVAVVIFLIGYYYVDKYFWFGRGTWTFIAVPCLEIIAMFILTTVYKYMTEEAERKKLKGAFQHYLSPEVIHQMLEHPEELHLGGVRRELTVLFSDVRGFTTISESLSPEKLCELMNDYFTPMTSLILRSGGVLDKYIGDAIMAFWGAPVPLPNNADIAAQVALDMLAALERVQEDFKRKRLPIIEIGIGINTGPMSVGNMGSDERFTYTVMGDAVNLGSRLEGLTKDYGIQIMISEYTYRMLSSGRFFTRDIDDIRVKGKHEPVHVFELMRPDSMRSTQELSSFIQSFNAGRKAYKAKDWQSALQHFEKCRSMSAKDLPSGIYIERCSNFLASPPAADWDGIYTFTHK
jgi:adenylate cyclase